MVSSYNTAVSADKSSFTVVKNPGPDTLALDVTNLAPATLYNCSLAAQTSAGYGPSVSITWGTAESGEYKCK